MFWVGTIYDFSEPDNLMENNFTSRVPSLKGKVCVDSHPEQAS